MLVAIDRVPFESLAPGGAPSGQNSIRDFGKLEEIIIILHLLIFFSIFSVFPVERDIHRPGYIAFFIKPSPFEVNNTAFYNTAITTRRPWGSTVDPALMARANNDRLLYNRLKEEEFLSNKMRVKDELIRREAHYKSIEAKRRNEVKNELDIDILTTVDQSMAKT